MFPCVSSHGLPTHTKALVLLFALHVFLGLTGWLGQVLSRYNLTPRNLILGQGRPHFPNLKSNNEEHVFQKSSGEWMSKHTQNTNSKPTKQQEITSAIGREFQNRNVARNSYSHVRNSFLIEPILKMGFVVCYIRKERLTRMGKSCMFLYTESS